ncbi:TetR/AcrR family transcriptional regulator [Chitinimonas sp.]|uniref:TetR/AcrR family transcriptional regulator n=1 Tax=Chitinimonas sp. TaxID=1934313 RepID=UPI0035AF1191
MTNSEIGRRERKRQLTAELLANTAFALFEAHGFDNVSMEQIAEAADVAKGTLYKHFPVKEALLTHYLHAMVQTQLPVLQQAMASETDSLQRITRYFRAASVWAQRHQRYMPYYLEHRLSQPIRAQDRQRSGTESILIGLISDAQAQGRLRADHDASLLTSYLQTQYLTALLRWVMQADADLDRELDAMLDLFLHGCRAERQA